MILLLVMLCFLFLVFCFWASDKIAKWLEKKFNWDYGSCLIATAYGVLFFIIGLIMQLTLNF